VWLAGLALPLIIAEPALTQTTSAVRDDSVPFDVVAEDDQEAEDILVTGSREANATISGLRVEPIRLPQNVRVIDQEVARDLGAVRIADVFALSGVTQVNTNGGSWDNYSIRGFAGDVNTGPDLLINRFNANRGFNAPRDIATMERFEVLKGPASALSGKGEPGGTINVVSKAPLDRFHALAEVAAASFDQYRGVLDVTGPVNDAVNARAVLVREDNGSFRDFVGNDRLLFAPSVAIEPAAGVRFLYQLEYSLFRGTWDRGLVIVDGNPKALPRDRFLGEQNDRRDRQRTTQHQGTLFVDLARGLSLEAGVQYRQGDILGTFTDVQFGNALEPANAAGQRFLRRQYRTRDYEFDDLAGRIEVAAAGRLVGLDHQFRVGVDAFRFSTDLVDFRSTTGPLYRIDIFNPVYGQPKPPQTRTANEEELEGESIYAQDLIGIGPWFNLLLGVRHDWVRQRTLAIATNGAVTTASQSPQATSPRAALTFAPGDTWSIYASWGRSFRYNQGQSQGGPGNPLPFGSPFDPERGRAWEAGVKYALLGGRLTGTVSAFDIRRENILVPGGSFLGSVAVGEAKSRGIEGDLNLALDDRFVLTGYYGYLDTRTTFDRDPRLVGRPLNNIPEHTGSVFARWASRGDAPGSVSLGGGATYVGPRAAAAATLANVTSPFGQGRLPGYLTGQVNLGYRLSETLSAQLDVRNVGDAYFLESSNNDTRIFPGAPRTVRLTLRAEV